LKPGYKYLDLFESVLLKGTWHVKIEKAAFNIKKDGLLLLVSYDYFTMMGDRRASPSIRTMYNPLA